MEKIILIKEEVKIGDSILEKGDRIKIIEGENNLPDWINNAETSNMQVEFDGRFLVWSNGIWESGVWKLGTWESGEWKSGTWSDGWWENGIWKSGVWMAGDWRNGTWENGEWKYGTWDDGVWERGTWLDGYWNSGDWESGDWKEGWIYDPEKRGNFEANWRWRNSYVRSPISPKEYFKNS